MDSSTHLMDAMELMDSSQMDDLTRELENKVRQDPKDLRSLLLLGNGYYLRGKVRAAIDTFEKAIQVNPSLPYAYYYQGISLYRAMRLDEAIQVLEKAVEVSPGMVMIFYWLGIAYYHKGLYTKARAAFEILLHENAESIVAHYHAALACIADESYECALHHLESLSARNTDDPQVQLLLGNCYYRLNKIDKAVDAYRKGLEKNPGNVPLLEALSYLTDVQNP
jgi:tetratricopeptide (TPR) repeat protein